MHGEMGAGRNRKETAAIVSELRTDIGAGLTGAEAAGRLRAGGPNEPPEGAPLRPGRFFKNSSPLLPAGGHAYKIPCSSAMRGRDSLSMAKGSPR